MTLVVPCSGRRERTEFYRERSVAMLKTVLMVFLLAGLAGLAGVEYFHHRSHAHAAEDLVCVAPHIQLEGAREMLRQHLISHR